MTLNQPCQWSPCLWKRGDPWLTPSLPPCVSIESSNNPLVRRKDLPPSDRGYTDDPRRAHERVIRNEINRYRFVIRWKKAPQRSHSSSRPYDTVAQNLPPTEREKNLSVTEELKNQRKALREGWVLPGSERWEAVNEKIAYLEARLAATGALSSAACRSR
jgi:hypothetical protein